jgi:hypothetical protein
VDFLPASLSNAVVGIACYRPKRGNARIHNCSHKIL